MEDPYDGRDDRAPEPFLPETTVEILKSAASWIRVASIIGFIAFVFSMVRAIGLLSHGPSPASPAYGTGLNEYRLLVSFIGVIAFIPSIFLFISANKISTFCESRDYNALEGGLRLQRRFWKSLFITILIAAVAVPVILILLMSRI